MTIKGQNVWRIKTEFFAEMVNVENFSYILKIFLIYGESETEEMHHCLWGMDAPVLSMEICN